MKAEYIPAPISGDFEEIHFGGYSTNLVWVKFTNNDFENWVGSFVQGGINLNNIYKVDESGVFFILAFGNGYLIDANKKIQISKEVIKSIDSAVLDKRNKVVYFSNSSEIKIIDLQGNIEIFYDEYFFDVIDLIEIKDNKLFANYWYYQKSSDPYRIEFDIISKEIRDNFYKI